MPRITIYCLGEAAQRITIVRFMARTISDQRSTQCSVKGMRAVYNPGPDLSWCLGTMEAFGPDDSYVHATVCRNGRSCFRRE